jgi:hypothetical protein
MSIDEQKLTQIVETYSHSLTYLHIGYNICELNDKSLCLLCEKCTFLETLSLGGLCNTKKLPNITDLIIRTIQKYCLNLVHLNLFWDDKNVIFSEHIVFNMIEILHTQNKLQIVSIGHRKTYKALLQRGVEEKFPNLKFSCDRQEDV